MAIVPEGETARRAWIVWDDEATWGEAHGPGAYHASIEGPGGGAPAETLETRDLRQAIAWARDRTSWVMARPSWDEGRYYWAGDGSTPDSPDQEIEVIPPLPPPPWPTG